MISVFFFNDTATTEIYTLSLHDALPISKTGVDFLWVSTNTASADRNFVMYSYPYTDKDTFTKKFFIQKRDSVMKANIPRSEEHTSELQSRQYLVCRLLLEKKKKKNHYK